ncbi:MAG: hypothetical protein LBL99_02200, partial [Holosporaceae bacterium]|jgi:superfamily I DNA and/or RNA helicase|nr:hypothetical protein [Holosporaceae bacterium]
LLLNSFFIKDLLRTKNLLKNDKLTKNLKAYLQIDKPKKRVDVVRDFDALEEAVKPALTPASKWPSKNPLVLLQQAAVNLALSDLKDGGIMSVNGPPGTGKTTLLRDVYAGVILEKAKAMAAFDDPEQAFEFLGNKMKRGGEEIRLYKLDASLKGHEIIIASSNNKAVENVSAELPNKNAIDIEGDDFNYFRPLSDKLLNCETWGLAAAVLGNFKNVSNFYKTFWKDEDYSVRKYLAHVSGFPQIYEIIDENTKNRIGERPPKIISDSNAPNDKKQALENWKKVKGEFLALYNETIEEINRLEQKRKKKNLFVDSDFYNKSYEEKQLLAPWYSEELANLRNKLFFSSINLCKAFIDAAAKPLRHNLAALMRNIFRVTLDNRRIDLLPDLWSSLFIICPAISTTFASCYRMFNALPNESFGWLFIDEAGQATPQAAVGALRITRRVLAVGDPCQIEPVVGLPDSFTKEVCRKFNVDPDVFNAPEASVQTVADDASHYFAEFPTERASRIVGLPLLVHRRCGSPMFEISNKIAYGNMMTHSKNEAASDIKSYLGTSRWIDVKSASADKWSQEEGEEALALLQKLKENGASENSFYVVSPFRVVASNLRKMIKDRGVYRGWITNVDAWIYERIGTVHTAQGREAEAVILVLGAPDPSQEGARLWAGSKPNLLNVAVTRAKEALYVIGNRDLWKTAGVFNALSRAL